MKLTRYPLVATGAALVFALSSPGFGQAPSTSPGTTPHTTGQAPGTDSQTTAPGGGAQESVELSQVPKPALAAAQKALGTTPSEAKVVVGTSPQVYELSGKNRSGKDVKIHVSADGKLLKKGKSTHE